MLQHAVAMTSNDITSQPTGDIFNHTHIPTRPAHVDGDNDLRTFEYYRTIRARPLKHAAQVLSLLF
jgi:hypothetical protein